MICGLGRCIIIVGKRVATTWGHCEGRVHCRRPSHRYLPHNGLHCAAQRRQPPQCLTASYRKTVQNTLLLSAPVVLCSTPTCLLCCVLRYIFCLYVSVVLLCSASTTCLLSRPRQRAGDTTRVIQPPITPWLHRRQLNLFLKFSNMWSSRKVTAVESGG